MPNRPRSLELVSVLNGESEVPLAQASLFYHMRPALLGGCRLSPQTSPNWPDCRRGNAHCSRRATDRRWDGALLSAPVSAAECAHSFYPVWSVRHAFCKSGASSRGLPTLGRASSSLHSAASGVRSSDMRPGLQPAETLSMRRGISNWRETEGMKPVGAHQSTSWGASTRVLFALDIPCTQNPGRQKRAESCQNKTDSSTNADWPSAEVQQQSCTVEAADAQGLGSIACRTHASRALLVSVKLETSTPD